MQKRSVPYLFLGLLLLAGCSGNALFPPEENPVKSQKESLHVNAQTAHLMVMGKRLFDKVTFQGNGRRCKTCHLSKSGSVSPKDLKKLFAKNPNAPIFRSIDSDDGIGSSYTRLRNHATFRVSIPLPTNVTLTNQPSVRSVVVFRGASSTLNNPGIENVFMQDGRNATLQEQAQGAVNAHYQAGRQPTTVELDALKTFQQRSPRFYSRGSLRRWVLGGASAPKLPKGRTAREKRGRKFFEANAGGLCAHCHGGAALNATNAFLLAPLPVGTRFISILVSEFNNAGNPVRSYTFADPANPSAPPVTVQSPDPGRALISGNVADVNAFRIPTLWGVARTAPYFHDNSAKDLKEMMEHYRAYFALPPANITLTDRNIKDIIAYLKLL